MISRSVMKLAASTLTAVLLALILALSVQPCTARQWLWTLSVHALVVVATAAITIRNRNTFRSVPVSTIPYAVLCVAIAGVGGSILSSFAISQRPACGALSNVVLFLCLSPFSEELVFRGYLYTEWAKKVPRIWARVISAAIFAVIHPHETLSGFGLRFTIGYTAAGAKDLTGSLWAAILVHSLNNLLALADSGIPYYASRGILAVVVLVSAPAVPRVISALVRSDWSEE